MEAHVAELEQLNKALRKENQILVARAASSAWDAAQLRQTVTDVYRSLSWRVTAPLRFISKPLFAALHRSSAQQKATNTDGSSEPSSLSGARSIAAEAYVERADPFQPLLAELRRAVSVAVIPCAVPFSPTFNQRPISLAKYLASRGCTVVFVVWQWSVDEKIPDPFKEVAERIHHVPLFPFLENVDRIASASQSKGTYVCTLASRDLVEIVRPLRAHGFHVHYDVMDDWEEFHRGGEAPWFTPALEQEMVLLADSVTTVSESLKQKFERLRSDIEVVRNGYDPSALRCEQFIAARTPLEQPKVIGYFGHLSDAWFDWDTLFDAAGILKNVDFELIGYGISERSLARLAQFSNIRFAGLVPQGDLHIYAQKWWAGIIPFQPSTLSAAVDPLKVYEYLHLGLPVVAPVSHPLLRRFRSARALSYWRRRKHSYARAPGMSASAN
jgi:glycosyltransferase involved in cell wall biosynthesis